MSITITFTPKNGNDKFGTDNFQQAVIPSYITCTEKEVKYNIEKLMHIWMLNNLYRNL